MGTNYHNEALRKARILERQKQALISSHLNESSPEDILASKTTIARIKEEAALKELHSGNISGNSRYGSDNVIGVARERQVYDQSRAGPVRDNSKRLMNQEMKVLLGSKPHNMHRVWKG